MRYAVNQRRLQHGRLAFVRDACDGLPRSMLSHSAAATCAPWCGVVIIEYDDTGWSRASGLECRLAGELQGLHLAPSTSGCN